MGQREWTGTWVLRDGVLRDEGIGMGYCGTVCWGIEVLGNEI